MRAPKVSVILTSFNHDKHIREAIDSVLNQTFTGFELIIWDDASTDNSWYLINQYSDPRIKTFRNESQKRGIWGANKAISEVASGEYIAIHHSDDVWEPGKLEKQVAFLEAHGQTGAVFTNALAVTEDGSPLTDEKHFYFNIFDQPNRTRHEWLRFFFYHGNALCHPSVLIRKSCFADCGLYRFGLAQVGDFDMWIRLCLKHEIHVLPEKLVRFRVRDKEANASGDRPENRIRGLYEFYKLTPNYQKLTSFEDLVKVFPAADKYYRNGETDMGFALAMAALEKSPFNFTQLLGQDLLFEAISDPKRSENIKRLYDFDYNSFIALTARHDVFSREEVAALNKLQRELLRRIDKLNAIAMDRARILASDSWRLTAPVRAMERRLPWLTRQFRRLIQFAWWTITLQLPSRIRQIIQLRDEADFINASGLFDSDWYLARNPDVAAAGLNPLAHYIHSGAAEGRDPSPLFDSDWYLAQNPDVAAAGLNPLTHYIRKGAAEGRDPCGTSAKAI